MRAHHANEPKAKTLPHVFPFTGMRRPSLRLLARRVESADPFAASGEAVMKLGHVATQRVADALATARGESIDRVQHRAVIEIGRPPGLGDEHAKPEGRQRR